MLPKLIPMSRSVRFTSRHHHKWELYLLNQWGYYSKRDDIKFDAVWFRGTVFKCVCGALRFEPKGRNLQPSNVVQEYI